MRTIGGLGEGGVTESGGGCLRIDLGRGDCTVTMFVVIVNVVDVSDCATFVCRGLVAKACLA